jgi:glycosyltransferase involved in cell wall biosynthesis
MTVAVSAMVFTLNEEIHLPSCLDSLKWCNEVVVIDSFSTDRTEEIAREAGARFFRHKFEGFGTQRNWALENTSPRNTWILIMDADERVPACLAEEIGRVVSRPPKNAAAFRLRRRFFMWGRWLRYSGLYPTWVVRLIHKDRVIYRNRGHAESEDVQGDVLELQNDLIDENLKGIDDWFARQNRYATQEAQYECGLDRKGLGIERVFSSDPLARREVTKAIARHFPFRPFWYFLYAYLLRGGCLEGRDGLYFCLMKAMYQQMITVKKFDLKKSRRKVPREASP